MTLASKITYNRLLFLSLVVFSIIPDIGIKFSTAGFTWTVYRAIAMLCLCTVLIGSEVITIELKKISSKWVIFMAFWVAYGLILMFVGKYTDFHAGFIEWLSVFNGLIIFYAMSRYLNNPENRETAIKTIYWLLNLLILIGIFEIATGWHWITSAYNDPVSPIAQYYDPRMATGLMYNMNDFSALLTCMTPVLVDKKLGKKRLITFVGVLFINLQNDANTCVIAIIMFILFYLLFLQGGKNYNSLQNKTIMWVIVTVAAVLLIVSGTVIAMRNDFFGSVMRQIVNAKKSTGSLYERLTMYKDAFMAWFSTGMLGMGPSGFPNYFSVNRSASSLVNPHSMVLEVLSQYGIVVCAWFLGLLVQMYRSGRRLYEMADERCKTAGLMVVSFVIVYFIASFAPSNFIGYSYQWLLLAVMSSLLNYSNETGGNELCLTLH